MSPATVVSTARRWAIAGLLFASGLINYLDRSIVAVALPLIALDLHLGPAAKGVLLSAFFWSYAIMQIPMGWLADRCDLRWVYAGFFAAWSLACGFTGFAGALGTLIVLRIVLGIGESIYVPGGMKIVSLLFEHKERGLASGIMNCGTRAGLAVGAPVIAWLVVRWGWKNAYFVIGFSSLVWLVPWLLTFPARHKLPARSARPQDDDHCGISDEPDASARRAGGERPDRGPAARRRRAGGTGDGQHSGAAATGGAGRRSRTVERYAEFRRQPVGDCGAARNRAADRANRLALSGVRGGGNRPIDRHPHLLVGCQGPHRGVESPTV